MQRHRGFSLIELMITVAIVAILAVIAYPSYRQYVVRGHRSSAQTYLMDLAQREEQFFLDNRNYGTLAQLGVTAPGDVAADYNIPANAITVTPAAPNVQPAFTIRISPTSSLMAGDGDLYINSQSQRWRDINGNGALDPGEEWK